MRRPAFAFAALGLGLAPAAAQDAVAGKIVAQTICAICHIIDGTGSPPGSPAPGFVAVARAPSTTELSLKVFLQSPHASMPMVRLDAAELNNVVAYILSLNTRT